MTSGRVEDEEKKNMSFDCGANNEVKAAFLMCDKNKNPFSLLCPLYYYVTMLFCFMSLPSPLLLGQKFAYLSPNSGSQSFEGPTTHKKSEAEMGRTMGSDNTHNTHHKKRAMNGVEEEGLRMLSKDQTHRFTNGNLWATITLMGGMESMAQTSHHPMIRFWAWNVRAFAVGIIQIIIKIRVRKRELPLFFIFAAAFSVCFLHEYGILCFVFLWCLCMKRQACWIGYVIGYICSDVDVFVEAQNKPVYSAIPFYYCWARFIFYSFPFQQWFSVCFLREFLSFVNC